MALLFKQLTVDHPGSRAFRVEGQDPANGFMKSFPDQLSVSGLKLIAPGLRHPSKVGHEPKGDVVARRSPELIDRVEELGIRLVNSSNRVRFGESSNPEVFWKEVSLPID